MRRFCIALAAVVLGVVSFAPQLVRADDVSQPQNIDQKIGTGSVARDDSQVSINYTGWLYDAKAPDHRGRQFDSSYDPGRKPLSFTLGASEVIPGMEHGVRGMHVGGKRRLIIPSRMGYGARGAGADIPPGSALIFDVELVEVH